MVQMIPPDNGQNGSVAWMTNSGVKSYSSTPGLPITVLDADVGELTLSGWRIQPSTVNSVAGLSALLANGGFQILTDRPVNIASATPLPLSTVRSGTSNGYTVRMRQRALFPATHIKLQFGNFTAAGTQGSTSITETAGNNPVEYRAGLQKLGSSLNDLTPALIPLTFNNGNRFGQCPPDGLIYTDPVAFEVDAAEIFFVWVAVRVNGMNWYLPCGFNPQGAAAAGQIANGDGYAFDDVMGTPASMGFNGGSNMTGPVAILGFSPTQQRSVAGFGDSIFQGTGDAGAFAQNGGYGQRLMQNQTAMVLSSSNIAAQVGNFPGVWMARGGGKASDIAPRLFSYKEVRIAEQASTVWWEYGTNDLGVGLSVMQGNVMAVARWFLARSKKFIANTILPKTTSTDLFLTIGNQTVTGSESARIAYNNWIRDTSVNGFISWASGLSGPAWAPSTSYATIGQTVQVGTNVYAVTTAGTSASSGSGPTGTGSGIVDGTVVWKYLTPIMGLVDFIDAAATIEVNAAGVPTLNGGFWPAAYSANDYTGSITTASSSGQWTDSGLSNTLDQYKGYNVRLITVANAVLAPGSVMSPGILNNAVGANNILLAPAFNLQSGTLQVGDTYAIYRPYTQDGTHPSTFCHMTIANALNVPSILAKFI